MEQSDHLSGLIGEIYDASLNPELWPRVIERSCGFVGGWSGGLFAQDTAKQTGNAYYTWNIADEYVRSYFAEYLSISPFMPTLLFFGVGEVVRNEDLIPHEEFRQTRFYKGWARPQGLLDTIASNVEKSSTSHAVFSIMRHESSGTVDDKMRRQFGLLVPHIRRAVLIGKVIDLHKVEAAEMADAFDGLAAGAFLLDARARIVHANRRGRAMTEDEQDVLKSISGRLVATDQTADRSLSDIFASASIGDMALGTKGIAVPLNSTRGERWVAHVLPLTTGARRSAGTAYSAVAAAFVQRASIDLLSPVETMANLYKLTPAEMRVTMMLVQVGGVPEVAPVLGISETTVKTHLQRIFSKTGTSRQADLVKLVAGYISPFADRAIPH
jgi:DNA-binding CsgD family transcriptional regulator